MLTSAAEGEESLRLSSAEGSATNSSLTNSKDTSKGTKHEVSHHADQPSEGVSLASIAQDSALEGGKPKEFEQAKTSLTPSAAIQDSQSSSREAHRLSLSEVVEQKKAQRHKFVYCFVDNATRLSVDHKVTLFVFHEGGIWVLLCLETRELHDRYHPCQPVSILSRPGIERVRAATKLLYAEHTGQPLHALHRATKPPKKRSCTHQLCSASFWLIGNHKITVLLSSAVPNPDDPNNPLVTEEHAWTTTITCAI
jgi:hypothetical protein